MFIFCIFSLVVVVVVVPVIFSLSILSLFLLLSLSLSLFYISGRPLVGFRWRFMFLGHERGRRLRWRLLFTTRASNDDFYTEKFASANAGWRVALREVSEATAFDSFLRCPHHDADGLRFDSVPPPICSRVFCGFDLPLALSSHSPPAWGI